MEKLKVKHDHKLTDILKVGIFAIFLILPFMVWLPTCIYYGANKYTEAPTTQAEIQKDINFSQIGNPINATDSGITITYDEQNLTFSVTGTATRNNGPYFFKMPDQNAGQLGFYTIPNHKYYVKTNYTYASGMRIQNTDGHTYQGPNVNTIWTSIFNEPANCNVWFRGETGTSYNINDIQVNCYDLTAMFGTGNEPTIEQFNTWFTEYYPYILNVNTTINTGQYETYTDIQKDINYAWQSTWKQPILNWTNTTILKQGLDNFTKVFGVTDTSYFTNLITYELIIVAIYIVIDIILTLFKWLTHLVGSKE